MLIREAQVNDAGDGSRDGHCLVGGPSQPHPDFCVAKATGTADTGGLGQWVGALPAGAAAAVSTPTWSDRTPNWSKQAATTAGRAAARCRGSGDPVDVPRLQFAESTSRVGAPRADLCLTRDDKLAGIMMAMNLRLPSG